MKKPCDMDLADWPEYWEKTLVPSMHNAITVLENLPPADIVFVALHVAAFISVQRRATLPDLQNCLDQVHDFWSSELGPSACN